MSGTVIFPFPPRGMTPLLSSGAAPGNQGAAHNPNLAQVYHPRLRFRKADTSNSDSSNFPARPALPPLAAGALLVASAFPRRANLLDGRVQLPLARGRALRTSSGDSRSVAAAAARAASSPPLFPA